MPSRKTKFVKFRVQFALELDHLEPFDSIPIGPPDINAFIAAGMNALGVDKGNILPGSRFGMDLHFPRPSPGPIAKKSKKRKA